MLGLPGQCLWIGQLERRGLKFDGTGPRCQVFRTGHERGLGGRQFTNLKGTGSLEAARGGGQSRSGCAGQLRRTRGWSPIHLTVVAPSSPPSTGYWTHLREPTRPPANTVDKSLPRVLISHPAYRSCQPGPTYWHVLSTHFAPPSPQPPHNTPSFPPSIHPK
jgi:hypothetical protein